MTHLFPTLDDSAQLWIWVADRPLAEPEKSTISAAVDGFIADWTTHGRAIHGAATVLFDQVLVLAGEVSEGEISGCGIDKSTHLLEGAAERLGFSWSSALDVPLLESQSGPVRIMNRTDFRREIAEGRVSPDDLMVDRTLTRLADARRTGLCRLLRDSWAARYVVPDATAAG